MSVTETETPTHTVPTSGEIAEMVNGKTTDENSLIAVNKQTSMAYFAVTLQDGIGYRPFISKDESEWSWLRDTDFKREFTSYGFVNIESYDKALKNLIEQTILANRKFKLAVKVMGPKSLNRLKNMIFKASLT